MLCNRACIIATLIPLCAAAQSQVLKGEAAFGDWRSDKPGVRRMITVQDLPARSHSTTAVTELAPAPGGAKPSVPEGFTLEVFAHEGLKNPRALRIAPNGDVFVADSMANQVLVYHVNGKHDVFASGLHEPYGIAFYPVGPAPRWVYIGNSN